MRRLMLGLASLWMCSMALGRSARASENTTTDKKRAHTDVEVVGLYGQSSGWFGCGEQGKLRYAGGGARIRHSMRAPHHERGMGAMVAASALVEADQVRVEEEDFGSFLSPQQRTVYKKRSFGMTSLDLRGGYYFPYFGMEVGLGAWLTHRASNLQDVYVLPETEITIGALRRFFFIAGVGAPHLSMIRTWGGYVGLGAGLPNGGEIRLYYSHFLTPQTQTDRNLEALWYLPINHAWDFRASNSVAFHGQLPDMQTSLGARVRF